MMNKHERRHVAQQILVILIVILTLASLIRILVAGAQEPPRLKHAPDLGDQWTPAVHTLLAAAVVGEAGWARVPDHDAIPWVVYRRWQAVGGSFEGVLRQYCRALDGIKRPWLLELDGAGLAPGSWPVSARWSAHRIRWLAIHKRIGEWAQGRIKDPCGAPIHWGSPTDRPQGAMVPVVCIGARNRFYEVRR